MTPERIYEATYKVPGGKMIRVRTQLAGMRLMAPQLSGDFFLMPPERLVSLEQFLNGWDLSVAGNAQQLSNRLAKFLQREQITLSGIDADGVAHVIDLVRLQLVAVQSEGQA